MLRPSLIALTVLLSASVVGCASGPSPEDKRQAAIAQACTDMELPIRQINETIGYASGSYSEPTVRKAARESSKFVDDLAAVKVPEEMRAALDGSVKSLRLFYGALLAGNVEKMNSAGVQLQGPLTELVAFCDGTL